jgi:hypothetical protein
MAKSLRMLLGKTEVHRLRHTYKMTSGARKQQLMDAANLLLDARRTATPIDDLPLDLQPENVDEAYFVQDTISAAYGPVGGWKIGAPTPEASPMYAPLPAA